MAYGTLPADFSEAAYLKYNPDVAAAVKRGNYPSGANHYINSGWLENRQYKEPTPSNVTVQNSGSSSLPSVSQLQSNWSSSAYSAAKAAGLSDLDASDVAAKAVTAAVNTYNSASRGGAPSSVVVQAANSAASGTASGLISQKKSASTNNTVAPKTNAAPVVSTTFPDIPTDIQQSWFDSALKQSMAALPPLGASGPVTVKFTEAEAREVAESVKAKVADTYRNILKSATANIAAVNSVAMANMVVVDLIKAKYLAKAATVKPPVVNVAPPVFVPSVAKQTVVVATSPAVVPAVSKLPSDFSEAAYLKYNPDIATAVKNGNFPSGANHYINFGWKENRQYKEPAVTTPVVNTTPTVTPPVVKTTPTVTVTAPVVNTTPTVTPTVVVPSLVKATPTVVNSVVSPSIAPVLVKLSDGGKPQGISIGSSTSYIMYAAIGIGGLVLLSGKKKKKGKRK